MESLQTTEIQHALTSFPMEATSKYHKELATKFENVDPNNAELNQDGKALFAFNGYYTLNTAKGAFFAVDTNMHMKIGASKPIYDISFIVSIDGKTSQRIPFTGTFNNNILTQTSEAELGINLDLHFTREDNNGGITASFAGSITMPGKPPTTVTGATYNNPIHYEIYEGTYFNKIKNSEGKEEAVKVLEINNGYEILFDYGTNEEPLIKVPSFSYNLNMYFFSFTKGNQLFHLIMGTGAAKGLVAGNMTITTSTTGKKTVASRQLISIPNPKSEKPGFPNLKGGELANFSGYYTLPSIHPNAFLSIQAEYTNIDSLDVYAVMISYSLKGKKSKGVYFDEGSMTFKNDTLTIPSEDISITFNRTYNPANKSLISITGTIGSGSADGGYTPFNPVPLTAFGAGVKLTGKTNSGKENVLEIISDNEVKYNGVTMKSFIYVPLMYILAYPIDKPTLVLSFGSDGVQGNSCIITDYAVTPNTTTFVTAIPNQS